MSADLQQGRDGQADDHRSQHPVPPWQRRIPITPICGVLLAGAMTDALPNRPAAGAVLCFHCGLRDIPQPA
jgi:hypothetical protein